jgi:hemolysin III
MKTSSTQTVGEEIANSVTHGVGFGLSVAGFVALVALTATRGTAVHIVSCAVFGAALMAVYLSSALYHGSRTPRARHVLKVVDHCAIYLLIAGTYTPFTLVTMQGGWGWTLFGVVWGLAACGIVFKVFLVHRFKLASTIFYVLMGWLVVIAIEPLAAVVPGGAIAWLLAGGLAYTAGTAFYLWKRLPYGHAVWHLFVLAGSLCHYFAVLFYVVPKA